MIPAKILPKLSLTQKFGDYLKEDFSVSTDSRQYKSPQALWAFEGEKFNAFKFAPIVCKQGCPLIVFKDSPENILNAQELYKKFPQTTFMAVKDPISSYQELARFYLKELNCQIIAITGSNGKTTHKEMLAHFLEGLCPGEIHWTTGNFNNHIGLPHTLLKASKDHRWIILEMGSNHPGEIETLCQICDPSIGLITNIGAAHLEFFHDLAGVFQEKRTLFDWINKKDSKKFVLNVDDPFLKKLSSPWVRTVGEQGKFQLHFGKNNVQISPINVTLKNDGLTGEHNFRNLAITFLMADILFPHSQDKLTTLAQSFTPRTNRSSWVKWNNKQVYLDAYNANPSSMKAAIMAFSQAVDPSLSFIILGDMLELGDDAPVFHEEIGRLLKKLKFSQCAFIGQYAKYYQQGCPTGHTYKETQEFHSQLSRTIKDQKWIFLKGSRSLKLESLLDTGSQ